MKDGSNSCFKTSIGGQALIEGIMMRNPSAAREKTSMAVRKPDGEIHLEVWENDKQNGWYRRTPFVRGIFNFISMLMVGYKALMRSAEISGLEDDEEEPSAFEKFLRDKLGDSFSTLVGALTLILGLALAIGLFMVLPSSISMLVSRFFSSQVLLTLVEGVIKIAIYVCYLALISNMKEIRRTFEYHGAEHKTIF